MLTFVCNGFQSTTVSQKSLFGLQDLLGKGQQFSPRKVFGQTMGLVHDFAWGIFGRIPELRDSLTSEWAGKPQMLLVQDSITMAGFADIL